MCVFFFILLVGTMKLIAIEFVLQHAISLVRSSLVVSGHFSRLQDVHVAGSMVVGSIHCGWLIVGTSFFILKKRGEIFSNYM